MYMTRCVLSYVSVRDITDTRIERRPQDEEPPLGEPDGGDEGGHGEGDEHDSSARRDHQLPEGQDPTHGEGLQGKNVSTMS